MLTHRVATIRSTRHLSWYFRPRGLTMSDLPCPFTSAIVTACHLSFVICHHQSSQDNCQISRRTTLVQYHVSVYSLCLRSYASEQNVSVWYGMASVCLARFSSCDEFIFFLQHLQNAVCTYASITDQTIIEWEIYRIPDNVHKCNVRSKNIDIERKARSVTNILWQAGGVQMPVC